MRKIRCLHLLLVAFVILAIPAASHAQVTVGVAIRIGPPPLPVYAQPICPGPRYIWTPGYWAYGDDGYYWVPGTWVMAPQVGFLWTPGYWGWGEGVYLWHRGYWGRHVGFYGGVHYGFGYGGVGFVGGEWRGREFFYNRSVNNVNVTVIHNTYNRTVVENNVTRVSYNGGNGGINARPTHEEESAANERHIDPTAAQVQHRDAARTNRAQLASVNHGHPAVVATPRPGQFRGRGVVRANGPGGAYRENGANGNRGANRNNQMRPNRQQPNGRRPEGNQRNQKNAPPPKKNRKPNGPGGGPGGQGHPR